MEMKMATEKACDRHCFHYNPTTEQDECIFCSAIPEPSPLSGDQPMKPTGVMCLCCGYESFKTGGYCDYCFLAKLQNSKHQCKPNVASPPAPSVSSDVQAIIDRVKAAGEKDVESGYAGYWVRREISAKDVLTLIAAIETPPAAPSVTPTGQTWEHCFKNFHRNLCERFGYSHDEVDWFRDQISLEEFIAAKVAAPYAPPVADQAGEGGDN